MHVTNSFMFTLDSIGQVNKFKVDIFSTAINTESNGCYAKLRK